MQFSADNFFQLTKKSECLSRYVAAFRDVFIAAVAIAIMIKGRYIVQPYEWLASSILSSNAELVELRGCKQK